MIIVTLTLPLALILMLGLLIVGYLTGRLMAARKQNNFHTPPMFRNARAMSKANRQKHIEPFSEVP